MKKYFSTLFIVLFGATLFSQNITLESFATGFSFPVDLKNAGDARLFVVEQGGLIKILNADGTTNATPFLDISSLVSGGSEQGLLGLAFHPNYAANGYFYVNYTDNSGDTEVSRFSVSAGDPDVADPNSEFPIIAYNQPFSNHNGGSINFGPDDGFLYISAGDGGSGGDPGNRAQNTEILLGKLLRIDVDNPGGGNNYGIPVDNPFAGDPPNAEEIWAYGLRNPWKFSFDRDNGDLWIADVGQNAIEEINKAGGTEAGLNYGWRCYEGSLPFNTAGCPNPSELTFPIAEYPHPTGFSITGGYVYRGSVYSDIAGYYFCGDFGTGLIATVDPGGSFNNLGTFGGSWSSFGQDITGELYIVNYNGQISKILGETLSLDNVDTISISMYPNPSNDKVTIRLDKGRLTKISVIDLKGSVLYSVENIQALSKEINIEGLSQGIYLVKITSEKGTAIKKLLKQ
ncbi:MAG: T9SS type A sorting domain-containing protein [Bacteroidetes bacterium]|nr:MAG: T9SS type A sorting domain-containing protein [Bacteroidota bacterium]